MKTLQSLLSFLLRIFSIPILTLQDLQVGFSVVPFFLIREGEARWKSWNQFILQFISIQTEYLVKIGSSQYFFSSPKTSLRFLLHPRENPFLSGPFRNVGARNVSVKEKRGISRAIRSQGRRIHKLKLLHCEKCWASRDDLDVYYGKRSHQIIKEH